MNADLAPPRWRWLVLLPLAALAAYLDDPDYAVIWTIALLPMIAFVEPLVLALAGIRRAPSTVSGTLRIAATLAAAGTILAGASVAGAHTSTSGITGPLLGLIGMAGAVMVWWPPRRGPWKAPAATILFGILTLMCCSVVPKFEGVKSRAYYNAMRDDAHTIQALEDSARQVSGRYTDSLAGFEPATFVRYHLERTRDGYRAGLTSEAVADAACAVYVGALGFAPAREPGVVTCTPFAVWQLGALGEGWLFALALGVVSAALALRRLPRTRREEATVDA